MASRHPLSNHLVVSCRRWEGDYWSHDITHGVATAPFTSTFHLVHSETGTAKELDVGVANPQHPRFSPDEKWLFFQSNASGQWQIYRCRPDGSGSVCLTDGHRLGRDSFGYEFSPDGRRVLFVSNDGKIGRLALMDSDGGNARIVAPGIGYHYMGSFSHDGQRIAFSHTEDAYRAKVMNLEGELLVTLTPDLPESFMPKFVAGDQALVFFRRDGDVYRVAADGGAVRRLTTGNVYYQFKLTPDDRHGSSDGPDLSPDGRRIAYMAVRDGVAQLHVMEADGSGQRQLTQVPGDCGRVKWSPDGERLAFVSFVGPARPQLFVIPAEGGEPRRLTDLPGAVYTLDWFPGGEFRST